MSGAKITYGLTNSQGESAHQSCGVSHRWWIHQTFGVLSEQGAWISFVLS